MSIFKKAQIKKQTRNTLREISATETALVGGGSGSAEHSSWINSVFSGGGASSEHSSWVRVTMM